MSREVEVSDRLRCDAVNSPADRVVDDEAEQVHEISQVNPGHPLPARAKPSSGAQAEWRQHALEGSTARIEYEADANPHHAQAERLRGLCFALPSHANFRQEAARGRSRFVQHFVAA